LKYLHYATTSNSGSTGATTIRTTRCIQ